MPVINTIVKLFLKDRLKVIDIFLNRPLDIHEILIYSFIDSAKETVDGK